MDQITQNLFYDYSFLSDLQLSEDNRLLSYVETKSDAAENDYRQRLHVYDTEAGKEILCTAFAKRYPYFMVDGSHALVIRNSEKTEGISTRFIKVDLETGKEEEGFTVSFAVTGLRVFNEKYYLASAVINRACPDYYRLSKEEQKKVDAHTAAEKDYIVFDEYPFFFNGEGIINGNRNTLFLIDRETYGVRSVVPATVDVESFDVEDGTIVYSGVDFTTFKGKWSHVWKYDAASDTTEKIFDGVMQIYRVFFNKKRVIVLGTFAREYGAMEAGKLYELSGNEMHLICDTEYSMHNSVGSDCRFGRTKNFVRVDDVPYFITSADEGSIVLRMVDDHLEKIVDFGGSCDDIAVGKDCMYLIAMKDQKLQEVYDAESGMKALTAVNEKVLEGKYVAVPEKVVVNKPHEIRGWVLKPKDYDPSCKYPAIMDIHGGPKTNYGTVFYHEMQYWANLGYFVFFCNPRGSDGRGNEFADLRRNFGKIDYEDLMDFMDEVLKEYPAIDPDRVGVTGGSYGGYMTNWIIGHTHRFKCAASQRSISNWITEVCASDYGIDFPIEQEFDDLYSCQEELWDMSPLKYSVNATTPTLFLQSTEDYRCPIPEAIQMYTVLKCRGIESKLIAFKGENHELSRSGKPLHRSRRLSEITGWMEAHLK